MRKHWVAFRKYNKWHVKDKSMHLYTPLELSSYGC